MSDVVTVEDGRVEDEGDRVPDNVEDGHVEDEGVKEPDTVVDTDTDARPVTTVGVGATEVVRNRDAEGASDGEGSAVADGGTHETSVT